MPHSCGRPQSSRHRLRIPYDVAAPTREEIAKLAYSYWEGRGKQGGSPQEDWLRAERELLKRYLE